MKKIAVFGIITTIFSGCSKEDYPQCVEGKVVWGDCAGMYVQILSKRSPIKNKIAFGNKGNINYKEVENIFFTDTIAVRGDSTTKTFLFQLQPFVKSKKTENGPCQHIIDIHTLEGTIGMYSVTKCN